MPLSVYLVQTLCDWELVSTKKFNEFHNLKFSFCCFTICSRSTSWKLSSGVTGTGPRFPTGTSTGASPTSSNSTRNWWRPSLGSTSTCPQRGGCGTTSTQFSSDTGYTGYRGSFLKETSMNYISKSLIENRPTIVSYQNESFSSKWELPFCSLLPS